MKDNSFPTLDVFYKWQDKTVVNVIQGWPIIQNTKKKKKTTSEINKYGVCGKLTMKPEIINLDLFIELKNLFPNSGA